MAPRTRRQMPRFHSWRRELWVPVGLVVAGVLGTLLFAAPESTLSGRPAIVDGDTLRLAGERIRLLGIDAPELQQDCADAKGSSWSCGVAARRQLADLVGSGSIDCRGEGRDRYRRLLAHCLVAGADLGEGMVKAGLAISDGDYLVAEAAAKSARIGIWQGSFTTPAAWRRRQEGDSGAANWLDMVTSWLR